MTHAGLDLSRRVTASQTGPLSNPPLKPCKPFGIAAVDADGMTGDGAGIHIEIPRDFFIEHIARTGHDDDGGRAAVGMVFLPRTDGGSRTVRCVVEEEILAFGHFIYGWRRVPVEISALGQKAIATRPEIEQIMFSMPTDISEEEAERQLYLVRRRIEKRLFRI